MTKDSDSIKDSDGEQPQEKVDGSGSKKPEQKPRYVDLDALGDDPAKSKSLSLGEISELSKLDPSQLTPFQKKQLDEVHEQIQKAITPMMPQLKESLIIGQRLAETIKKSLINVRLPNFDTRIFEPQEMHSLTSMVVPNIIPPASSTEQHKQTFLLQEIVKAFEAQNEDKYADVKNAIAPRYDSDTKCLTFCNRNIDVSKGKDYERFCKIMFRNEAPRKTPIQFGELLEKLGHDNLKDASPLRNLVNNFNNYIAKQTLVDDLFYAKNKEVHFNAKYI